MADETVTYGILTGFAPLAAIISDRVYYMVAPRDALRPYAVYNILGAVPDGYLDEENDLDRRTIQLNAYADTAEQARAIIKQSRKAMKAQNYACIAEPFSDYEDTTKLYHFVADFSLWLQN